MNRKEIKSKIDEPLVEVRRFLEVPPGFEPGIKVLQTYALPLGYGTLLLNYAVHI